MDHLLINSGRGPNRARPVSTNLRIVPLSAAYVHKMSRAVPLRLKNTSARLFSKPHPIDPNLPRWTTEHHWGFCGQSCPCCRQIVEQRPECKFCSAPTTALKVGRIVVPSKQGVDENRYSMSLVTYDDLSNNMTYTGWIYHRNMKSHDNFQRPAVKNNTPVTITKRSKDESGIDMFHIQTADGASGWVYAKNVVHKDYVCPICFDPIETCDLYTSSKCSHQFHRHCAKTWVQQGGSICPICRSNEFTP